MKQHSLTVFSIEELQAEWLSARWSRLVYHTLIGLIFGVVVFLAFGAFIGLFIGLDVALRDGLIAGAVIGLIGGLFVGLTGGRDSLIQPTEGIAWSFESFRKDFRSRLIRGVKEQLLGTLIFGVLVGLLGGLFIGLRGGLSIGLIGGSLQPHFFTARWRQESMLLLCI